VGESLYRHAKKKRTDLAKREWMESPGQNNAPNITDFGRDKTDGPRADLGVVGPVKETLQKWEGRE